MGKISNRCCAFLSISAAPSTDRIPCICALPRVYSHDCIPTKQIFSSTTVAKVFFYAKEKINELELKIIAGMNILRNKHAKTTTFISD